MKNMLLMVVLVGGMVACQNAEKAQPGETKTTETLTTELPTQPDAMDANDANKYIPETMSEQTADLVRKTFRAKFKSELEKDVVDTLSRKFSFFEYDLNEDGNKEIFVATTGRFFCGSGGCTIYLLDHQGNNITVFTVSDYPVVVDNAKSKGWKDLFIKSGGTYRVVKFNGKSYPANPSVQPELKVLPGDGLPRLLDIANTPYPKFSF